MDESGQVLVVTALSMIVLIGFVGFATDVGLLLGKRRFAQTLADSTAVAAAAEALNEGTPSTVTPGMWTAASHDAIMNGFNPGSSDAGSSSVTASNSGGTLTLNVGSSVTVSNFNSAGYVQSIVTVNSPTIFMSAFATLFGLGHPGTPSFSSVGVTATAIASDALSSDGCIYVQNDGGYATAPNGNAVDMGGNSLIAASQCGMTVNGEIVNGGSSSIDAKFVGETYSPAPNGWIGGIPPQPDPLSKLQDPSNQPMPGTVPGGSCKPPSSTTGTACVYDLGCSGGSCSLSGVNLQPSKPTIYYYDQGLSISGAITMTNAVIYLTNNAYFDFSSNGSGTFTPPGYGKPCDPSDLFCGILIDAPDDGNNDEGTYTCSKGKGNNGQNPGELYLDFGSSTTKMEGIVYAPYMQLFGQDEGASTTFATDLVVGNICMQSSTFYVNGFSGDDSPLTRFGLVY